MQLRGKTKWKKQKLGDCKNRVLQLVSLCFIINNDFNKDGWPCYYTSMQGYDRTTFKLIESFKFFTLYQK